MSLSSCFVRRRIVQPPGKIPNRPLLSATKDQLIARIHAASDPIQSFRMRADMSPSAGALYGGQVTDYATIRADVLFLRPDEIRVIGLDPVVHSTIFDMVSNGPSFRVYIPSKSSFIEGQNNAPPSSSNPLENLRPEAFRNALILSPPNPADATLVENDNEQAVYILLMVRQEQGQFRLTRSIYFDRYTLNIAEQKTFDASGGIVSQTRYSDWKLYNGVSYPTSINIERPGDGYEVGISVIEMRINPTDVTPDKFVLNQPPGAHLRVLK